MSRKRKLDFIFILSIVFVLLINIFFEVGVIVSSSMADTIKKGNYILIYKPIKTNTHRNEIVVFDTLMIPSDKNKIVKRCIGIPGDTIIGYPYHVLNGSLNGNINHYYIISFYRNAFDVLVQNNNYNFLRNYIQYDQVRNTYTYQLKISDFEKLKGLNKIRSIKLIKAKSLISEKCPTVVPYKGMKVFINKNNVNIYKKTMESFEGVAIKRHKDTYIINGDTTDNYIFKNNYYYVLGDNRHESFDSNNWGFLPQNAIIGKATHVLFSWSENNPYFIGRIFKKIE